MVREASGITGAFLFTTLSASPALNSVKKSVLVTIGFIVYIKS